MKRIFSLVLVVVMMLSLVSCTRKKEFFHTDGSSVSDSEVSDADERGIVGWLED